MSLVSNDPTEKKTNPADLGITEVTEHKNLAKIYDANNIVELLVETDRDIKKDFAKTHTCERCGEQADHKLSDTWICQRCEDVENLSQKMKCDQCGKIFSGLQYLQDRTCGHHSFTEID